jgi:hypothetical protein
MAVKINLKDLFWDMNISEEDVEGIVQGDDFRAKQFLFEKILLNSQNMIRELRIFTPKDLEELIENYKPSSFNKEYASRRKNIAETFFLGKPMLHPELKWNI